MKTPRFMFLSLLLTLALLPPQRALAADDDESRRAKAGEFANESFGKGKAKNGAAATVDVAECPENDQECRDNKAAAANASINAASGAGLAGRGGNSEPPAPVTARQAPPPKKKSLWQKVDGDEIKMAMGIGAVAGATAGCATGAAIGAGVGCAPGAVIGTVASMAIWGGATLIRQLTN
jgi:hypothetical protein